MHMFAKSYHARVRHPRSGVTGSYVSARAIERQFFGGDAIAISTSMTVALAAGDYLEVSGQQFQQLCKKHRDQSVSVLCYHCQRQSLGTESRDT
jgi:hypothetical protein